MVEPPGNHTNDGLALVVPEGLVNALAVRVAGLLADRLAPSAYMTVDQAAEYLACQPHRIYDLVSQRRVRAYKDGRRVLLRREDLDAALDAIEAQP